MRSKIVMMIFLAAVIVMLAALLFYVQKGKGDFAVEDVLPAGPLVYLRAVDLEKNAADLAGTALVKALQEVDIAGIMAALGAGEKELAFYQNIREQFFSERIWQTGLTLVGLEAAAAVYPSGEDAGRGPFPFLSRISVVVRLKPEAQILELLMGTAAGTMPDVSLRSEDYRGEKIYYLDLPDLDFPVGYVRFNDLLVLGAGDAAARRAVDTLRHGGPPLAQDQIFVEMKNQSLDRAQQTGFFHYSMFVREMKNALLEFYAQENGQVDQGVRERIDQGFEGMKGFQVFYFSGFYDRVMRWRLDAAFDPDAVSDEISKMRQDGGNANQNLSFIPEGIKLYSWNSFFGVDFYRTQLRQGMKLGSGAGLPSPEEELLKDRMDAVMALLRDEIGWYFFGVDLTGAIPLPQGVLFIGINDSEQARTLIQDFFEEDGSWRFKTERYQGREIRYVESIPFLDTLEPAFCVMNDYVLVAVNRGLIKEAVDTQEDPERSFLKQGVFKENRYAFDEKSHALFFADIHALMKDVSGILEWGNQWADVQLSRQMAFRDGLRTRLEEVEQEIIKKQEEQSLLSIRLAESLAQKEALEASLEDGEEIGKELDRKRRFLESVQRAVRSAEEEEQRLLAVQDDASRQLTEAGLKLLKDVQEDLRKKKTRENEILAEISGLEARYHQHRASMAKIEELSAQITQDENTAQDEEAHWTALEETRQELIETIRHYDEAGLPTSDQRQLVLNELIKPLLEALGRIESVFFQSRVLDNRIRSEVFIEVK